MNDKEKLIVEKKTAEAQAKNLMGFSGKMGVVMKALGQPIQMHCEGASFDVDDEYAFGYSDTQIYNYHELPRDDDDLPMMGDTNGMPTSWEWKTRSNHIPNDEIVTIGWAFNSLSLGFNLNLRYFEEDHNIEVHWNGIPVYHEMEGELKRYVNGVWEDKVNELYEIAKKLQVEKRKTDLVEAKQELISNKLNWLDRMKRFWGI